MQETRNRLIWTFLLTIFIFHGVLEDIFYPIKYFDEAIALLCFPLACYDHLIKKRKDGRKASKTKRAELGLLVTFLLCGLLGNILYQYQPWWVVGVSAILAAKFFMILLTAGYIQKYLPIDLEQMGGVIQKLSFAWFAYYVLSFWQGNILIRPEAWDICAKSSLLFVMLIFCKNGKVWGYRIAVCMMAAMLILSGKEKAYGTLFIFAAFYYLIVHKQVQAKLRYVLYMAVPIIFLAWDKIYFYYVQGHDKFAKSIMTSVSLQIAKDYFPIGTGFGTFGSTYAKEVYSPVYVLYGLAENVELGIESKKYLTDLFWPILFGETGVLGTLLYCALILLLFVQIQRVYFYNKRKYCLLLFMLVFMLMTTFTEAGFMQPVVMVFAFVMGNLLEEYAEKRNEKMKYFQ